MKLTEKQKEILDFITENEKEIKKLKNLATVKLSDLKIVDSVEIAGISWSKFAEDENGNSMMLANDKVCEMEFGENNDWRTSKVREKCREIAEEIKDEIGDDAIVEFDTDLFSHDGLRDYGTVLDEVAILTYDLYRNNRENIKEVDFAFWLSTPDSTPSGCGAGGVRYVDSGGDVCCRWCIGGLAVRPFFLLQS